MLCYNQKSYIVTKILVGGAGSLAVLQIKDLLTQQEYVAKIKANLGGLEIRNYISLDKYIDIFAINKLIIFKQDNTVVIKNNTSCLIQKIVVGENLSKAIVACANKEQQQTIIFSAIKALCYLHKKGYVHNDALPDNCKFNDAIMQAEFIDYDMMRFIKDCSSTQEWDEFRYLDFKRLLFGDKTVSNIAGLKDYGINITGIIEKLQDNDIDQFTKNKLLINL